MGGLKRLVKIPARRGWIFPPVTRKLQPSKGETAMHRDIRGLPVTAASAAAVAAYDHALDAYIGYRADMAPRMEAMFATDPDCGMAHVLKGYMTLLGFKSALVPIARAAADAAGPLLRLATPREVAHHRALLAWLDDRTDRAIAIWEQILAEHPLDVLAFRLHHFVNFWMGRPDKMLAQVLAVEPHWSVDVPGFNAILGCRAFAHEESGFYIPAEIAGRQAIQLDPGDVWSAHAVAHTLEMTGRRREGIAWIDQLQGGWDQANNLKHHLWWHQAMYHLELGDFARVLELHDQRYRNHNSPLVIAAPDLYIDVQNAASMLFRLARHGVDVGDRWVEIADKAEARIGDCQSAFTLPHWMMALAATGREDAAHRMLQGMREYGNGAGQNARLVRDVALPICQAVLAHGLGQSAWAVAAMRPVIGEMYRLGGSHAQQDVLEQLFLDAAQAAELEDDQAMIIERVSGRHPVPPRRRRGYAMAA
jgi:tetratricopeptide (TPR) repeat protein